MALLAKFWRFTLPFFDVIAEVAAATWVKVYELIIDDCAPRT